MTTYTGSRVTSGNNGLQLIMEVTQSPTTVVASTTSVTVTARLYLQTLASVVDSNNSWSLTGDVSGSGSASISHSSSSAWSTSNRTLVATRTRTFQPVYSGPVVTSFSATFSGLEAAPGTAKVSGSFTTAARPPQVPEAPTAVTIERVSDVSHKVKWTNTDATVAATKYSGLEVQRWDSATAIYKTIASPGVTTQYADTTTVKARQYRYRVRSKNVTGTSAWVYSAVLATSPNKVTNYSVSKSGQDSVVKFTAPVGYYTGVQVWERAGTVDGVSPLTTLSPGTTTWTHVDPDPGLTHDYRFQTITTGGLLSGFTGYTSKIQLLTNPGIPGQLSPSASPRDATEAIELTWKHNSVDGSPQKYFQVWWRPQGGSWTTTGKVASTVSKYVLPADSVANTDLALEWKVATWGDYAVEPSVSPESSTAVVTLSNRPIPTWTFPDTGSFNGSELVSTWTFYDSESSTQSQYRARLYDGSGVLVDTVQGYGSAASAAWRVRLENLQTYTQQIEVADDVGLWSLPVQDTFSVEYASPPILGLSGEYDTETGAVILRLDTPIPAVDEVEAVSARVYRSQGGSDWVLIGDNLSPTTALTDRIPMLNTDVTYKVEGVSELPSTSESAPLVVSTARHEGWIFFNAGEGFGQLYRIRDNAKSSLQISRQKELHKFDGRSRPVEFLGEHTDMPLSLSARIGGGSSSRVELMELSQLPAPICYRDPFGVRAFVSISSFSDGYERIFEDIQLSMTEVDFSE